MDVLEDVSVEYNELVAAAKEQWFGSNDIDIVGGTKMEDGREVVFIFNLATEKPYRFFLKRSDSGMLVLEEYPWMGKESTNGPVG